MDGIIPINKPRGMTSHDVVAKMRGILHTKKVGHSGTLDPNVDGVLPICVGKATKVVDYLMEFGKIYRGTITLGFSTTTEDLDGEIVEQTRLTEPLTNAQIDAGLKKLTGEITQIPPMYSAVKVHGRKLYEYARKNEYVERPKRIIKVDSFIQTKASEFDAEKGQQTIFFEVHCGKGTYVRTLAVDFGKFFNLPAVMSDLTRLSSGGFSLEESFSLEDVEQFMVDQTINEKVYGLSHALSQFPKYELSKNDFTKVQNGAFIDLPMQYPEIVLVFDKHVQALYKLDSALQKYRPKKMFLEG